MDLVIGIGLLVGSLVAIIIYRYRLDDYFLEAIGLRRKNGRKF